MCNEINKRIIDMVQVLKVQLLEMTADNLRLRYELKHYADDLSWERDENGKFKQSDMIDFGAGPAQEALKEPIPKGIGHTMIELAKIAYSLKYLISQNVNDSNEQAKMHGEVIALVSVLMDIEVNEFEVKDFTLFLGPIWLPKEAVINYKPVM